MTPAAPTPEARAAAAALLKALGTSRGAWKEGDIQRVLAFGADQQAAGREVPGAAWVGLLETARDHWHEDDARLGPCDLCRAVARVDAARALPADHPETPVHPGRFGTHAAARCLVCRARAEGEAAGRAGAALLEAARRVPVVRLLEHGAHALECLGCKRPGGEPCDPGCWSIGLQNAIAAYRQASGR